MRRKPCPVLHQHRPAMSGAHLDDNLNAKSFQCLPWQVYLQKALLTGAFLTHRHLECSTKLRLRNKIFTGYGRAQIKTRTSAPIIIQVRYHWERLHRHGMNCRPPSLLRPVDSFNALRLRQIIRQMSLYDLFKVILSMFDNRKGPKAKDTRHFWRSTVNKGQEGNYQ